MYAAPEKKVHTHIMRISPPPRDVQLGVDPNDQESLPVIADIAQLRGNETSATCLVLLRDPDSVAFFKQWDEMNVKAYLQHADVLGGKYPRWVANTEQQWFEQNYRRIIHQSAGGCPQIRITLELPFEDRKGTSIFKALPGNEEGKFRMKRATHEAVVSGSRIMVKVSAWYLGLSDSGYPTCRLHASELILFPSSEVTPSGTPAAFKVPEGISFEMEEE